ncbi:50S ribosomal protein L17 [Pseudodesulfovibrio sp. F-1]|uniref:Large ribosomal subunit protein bL17 n=1 Tax=Pseudodesulfovibrio alkaliphilus TaxID=2661613 RepID=A0A7K1KJC2_9BACT|nr:50S ribosomal protein L17 [Pseudodesulfovibrio alkaliphilus]MUM76159.1 50S ribosomal protein L17 [Pseudodesulfovibrio alkaliphilus]
MRHRKSGRKLNRSNSHRTAMFKNMARALLTYEQIRTTDVKAKELRRVVDKLITLALRNDLHSRRQAYKVLGNHQLVQRLFDEIGPRFAGGQGGYTRIIKLSQPRTGDCAPMVIIELTKKAADAPAPEKAEEKTEDTSVKKAPAKKATPKAETPAKESAAEEPAAEAAAPAEEPDPKKEA